MKRQNIQSVNSASNYEPTLRSRVVSIRSKEQRRVTAEQKRIEMIRNKYSAYRSNISNLEDKRYLVPNKSKSKQRRQKMNTGMAKPKLVTRQHRANTNRTTEINYNSQPEWVNELSSLGNLISATESLDGTAAVEQQPQIKELKKIADNADNLIRILNTLKDTMGTNKQFCNAQIVKNSIQK